MRGGIGCGTDGTGTTSAADASGPMDAGAEATTPTADSGASDEGSSASGDADAAGGADLDSSRTDAGAESSSDSNGAEAGAPDSIAQDATPQDATAQDAPDSAAEQDGPDADEAAAKDATDEQGDSAPTFDASGIDAGALCDPWAGAITQVTISYVDAAAPAASTFTGGALESGTYVLTSLTAYVGAFGNATTTGEVLSIDTGTGAIRNVYSDQGGAPVYSGFGFQSSAGPSGSLRLFALCPTSGASGSVSYTFTGSGPGAVLTWFSGDQVALLTKQ